LNIIKKIPELYPPELRISSLVSTLLNYDLYMISGLKVIKKETDCVTLHFA